MKESEYQQNFDESAIAVIGMSGRFPGAPDIETFWHNLYHGVESISTFTGEELAASGISPALYQDPHYVKAGGVVDNIDMFDAFFFGYSPGEAALMDPQHRLFLEHAWEAIEYAGYNPDTYKGLIGVYAGVSMNTYLYHNVYQGRNLLEPGSGYHTMVASDKDFLSTKVSYKLNLKGPSVTVQTACSTSLVAIHMACQSLRNGECDIALAGGVSVRVPHKAGYLYREGLILSPEGHCRAFDARAGGTVLGNGTGIVVLKLLEDAIADGDSIHAIIKGSAINNDGSLKAGYTAPGLDAQAAVITEALGIAGITAESITYVETHGTGTVIGDPIEVAALTKAFRTGTEKKGICAIGSVKTNIGHLDAAAGVAGFIKTVLMLKHKLIPTSLNFEKPNPGIDFAGSPFYVSTSLSEWKTSGTPRRAGVSSFGIGGTNAHVILEEAPVLKAPGESRPWQLLLLSAKTSSALDHITANLAEFLKKHPGLDLADVAHTLQTGRKTFEHRRFLVSENAADAIHALGSLDPQKVFTFVQEVRERPVAFMLTGQGSQYVNMGFELYQHEVTFRETVDQCSEFLKPHLGLDLRHILYPDENSVDQVTKQLTQTAITQPALFVIEYSLAKLWMEWGIRPGAMIGHSIGEYTAACLAGVFSLQDGLALVSARGRLMQQMPEGSMTSVPLTESELKPFLNGNLSVGVINGPGRCVVSGPTGEITTLEETLNRKGIASRRLHTSHAFHSAMMEPILEPFIQRMEGMTLSPPKIPFVSNVSGTWITAEEATDPGYWASHLRQTVRFSEGVHCLMQDSDRILLEVGPGQTLTTLSMQHPGRKTENVVLASMRRPQKMESDMSCLLNTLGKLWLMGVQVDWPGFYTHERRLRVPLPSYPFERQRYWIDHQERTGEITQATPPNERKSDIADWFYVPSWKRTVLPTRQLEVGTGESCQLIFVDECGLGTSLVKRLKEAGQDVVVVRAGAEFTRKHAGEYTLNPGRFEDYEVMLEDLWKREYVPRDVIHLWSITPNEQLKLEPGGFDRSQELGFYSLIYLAQALGKQHVTDELRITVISNGIHEVTGEETLCPEKATALGPVMILPFEYPHLQCRSIDVVLPVIDAFSILTDQILAEIAAGTSDSIIAYRRQHRWVKTYEPVHLETPSALPQLRHEGVYLITGGLGGIGFTLARHLAEKVQARLILLDRLAVPAHDEREAWLSGHDENDGISRGIRRINELEALGAEVLALCADVANPEQMQSAISQGLEQFGRINAVIHAAGVPGGGFVQLKTREMAEQIMAPKVRGTLILSGFLENVHVDWLMLCSSINAVVGRVGQVDYCAANAFLDAFAHAGGGNTPVISVNWDTWRDVGMAAETLRQQTGVPAAGVWNFLPAAGVWNSLPAAAGQNFSPDPETSQSGEMEHPLLDRCTVVSEEQSVYITHFKVTRQWELYEHGILGKPTLPGTAYLEMVRTAFESRFGNGPVEIRNAYFMSPLIPEGDEERCVYTTLKKQGDEVAFSIVSEVGDVWQEHARGTIASMENGSPGKYDLEKLKAGCSEECIVDPLEKSQLGHFDLDRRQIMRDTQNGEPLCVDSIVITEGDNGTQPRSMEFGPRWHTLKMVHLGNRQGLGLFELNEKSRADLRTYKLHPALLDFATSFLRLFKSKGSYLPLSYKRLRVMGPLPERVYSFVRCIEDSPSQGVTLRFNVTLMDENGMELVDVDEFAVIRVDDAAKLDVRHGSSIPFHLSGQGDDTISTRMLREDLKKGLSSREGVEIFDRILASTLPQVVVSPRDLAARIEQGKHLSLQLQPSNETQKPKHPRPNLMTAYASPRGEVEEQLAEIWQDVLGLDQVGIHDNFSELGGDSLLITQIHSRFTGKFKQDVSVASLLQYPTIAELAQFLSTEAHKEQPSFEALHERVNKQKAALKRRKKTRNQKRRLG